MIGLLILAAVAPLFVPATPTPSPLPEIGRVRSNVLCTTLRQNIAPTILGLMKNDEIIGAGHRAFLKMGHDQAGYSSASIEIDKLYLEQVETRLVHNLQVIDRLLGDEKRFPSSPRTADDRDAIALKSQLVSVADQQRRALDLISGTLETESLGQMQHDIDNSMQSAVGQTGPQPQTAATAGPNTFIGSAGLPDYSPVSGLPTTASKNSDLAGHTVYDSIAAALEGTQGTIARREQLATSAVLSAVSDCRASVAPSPVPSVSPASPIAPVRVTGPTPTPLASPFPVYSQPSPAASP